MSEESKSRNNPVLISTIVIAVLLLLVPWKSQIAPTWTIQVVDESGNSIPNLAVSENWVNPNLAMLRREEDYRTDQNGFVSFPERTTRRNVLLKTLSPIWNRVLGERPSYDAMAFGWGNYSRGEAYYQSGQPLPQKLVMYR